MLPEAEKVLLISWDQAPELTEPVFGAYLQNLGTHPLAELKIHLQHPTTAILEPADFRIPWTENLHLPFRETGNPYLNGVGAVDALAAMDRIARALGHLRVGVAMGSGAAYGYAIIGLLKCSNAKAFRLIWSPARPWGRCWEVCFAPDFPPTKSRRRRGNSPKIGCAKTCWRIFRFPRSGFLGGETLHAFLRSILGRIEFHQMPIPFEAIATDIRTGNEVVFNAKAASPMRCAHPPRSPLFFSRSCIKAIISWMADWSNPVPTSTVAKMGADILISMNLTAKPSLRRAVNRKTIGFPLAPRSPGLTEIIFKMIYTMQYEIAQARTGNRAHRHRAGHEGFYVDGFSPFGRYPQKSAKPPPNKPWPKSKVYCLTSRMPAKSPSAHSRAHGRRLSVSSLCDLILISEITQIRETETRELRTERLGA